MKILVCGSRSFSDYNELEQRLDRIIAPGCSIISGGAVGADSLAVQYAKKHNIPYEVVLPKWKVYGRSAGFKRNIEMLNMLSQNDLVVAFIVNNSKGSEHTVTNANLRNIKTIIFNYTKEF